MLGRAYQPTSPAERLLQHPAVLNHGVDVHRPQVRPSHMHEHGKERTSQEKFPSRPPCPLPSEIIALTLIYHYLLLRG